MRFLELNPWTLSNRDVESPTFNLLWKWYKLRIHYKIKCEFYPRVYPHKRVFLGFWIAKTHELPGAPLPGTRCPDPCQGGGVSGGQCMVWELLWNCIKWKLIKLLQFDTITSMLRHIIFKKAWKWGHDQNWGQNWLGSDRPNFTLWNRFSWTFKVLKPMSFRELRPLESIKGPKSGPWTPPVLGFAVSRSRSIPHLGIRGDGNVPAPTSCVRQYAHAT